MQGFGSKQSIARSRCQTLFSDQVKKHEELVNIIKQNCTAQDNILQALTDANADIADVRTKIGATFET